jgi:uncharacterized membrane protein
MNWPHIVSSALASFLASSVECVEALTVVLAVGIARGWRSALLGAGFGLFVLCAIVLILGPALVQIPLDLVRIAVGLLLFFFGFRWLRKAIRRAAGIIPLHNEEKEFAESTAMLRQKAFALKNWDKLAVMTSFKIVMLEGIEVVFIVIAIGATSGLLIPASGGALAALLLVMAAGAVLHRPLTRVPENALKFAVGVLLCAFGIFWTGEGTGIHWPGNDWFLLALIAGILTAALAIVQRMKRS